jgi:CBS-domain-containing membrane protein
MQAFQGSVADVLKAQPPREVVQIDSKANFFICLWQLQKHNISSAPLYDAEKKEYVGTVDLLDMVTFALVTFEDRKMLYERELLHFAANDLVNKPELNAHLISNMSTRNRFVHVRPDDSIAKVIELFTAESGLHRVCVLDEEKKLVGLVR